MNKKISDELIHEFTEQMDQDIPQYSDESENIVMTNRGNYKRVRLNKRFC